ncbi:MAG: helix-turn-helix transcriptional regulator, partial [Sphaerochaeta sp.]
MHYQAALSLLMEEQNISIKMLSKRTSFSERWLSLILKDPDWNPWLNTLLKLSEALRINVVTLVVYAEGGNRQVNLRTSEPQNLRTSEPQNLRTSEPQNLRTSEPQ